MRFTILIGFTKKLFNKNDSKQKIEMFLNEYPDYELDLIGETEYYSLRNLFKHKIPKWEGK